MSRSLMKNYLAAKGTKKDFDFIQAKHFLCDGDLCEILWPKKLFLLRGMEFTPLRSRWHNRDKQGVCPCAHPP